MNNPLYEAARKLRLSGLISSLEIWLQEAMSHGLSHAEFLELLLQDELRSAMNGCCTAGQGRLLP